MTNKNALAYLSEVETYKKFLSTADKTCTLILIYDNAAASIPISIFEAINTAKCKIEFRKLPDITFKNSTHKDVLAAFTFGQLSAEYPDLDILATFNYELPRSVRTRSRSAKKTSAISAPNVMEIKKEKPVKEKTSKENSRETKKISSKDVHGEQPRSLPTVPEPEKPKRTRKKASNYTNMTFDEQYDALLEILSGVKGFNASTNIKKVIDAVKMSINEKISIEEANKVIFTKDKSDLLNSSLKSKWTEITEIVKALKDEM